MPEEKTYNIKEKIKNLAIFYLCLLPFIKLFRAFQSFIESITNILYSLYYYKTIKIYLCNHFTIGIKTVYAKKTKFPHPVGIVIGKGVALGDNCTIFQNVTIGTKETTKVKNAQYPTIGNNVTIYPNSVVIGSINIGDNSIIGAGSIVLKNVPPNSVVVGNPATIKKLKLNDTLT